jgi:hypothetical protein
MPYAARRSYAGAAPACTLTNAITSSETSITLTGDVTNWNNTASGGFYMVIDPGLSTEEKVLVGSRSGSALSSITRGVDGTTASSHSAGATCYPVFTAVDADQANAVAAALTTKGDLLVTTGSALNRLAVGTNNQVLMADSAATNGVKWALSPETDLVTTKGDILVGTAADTLARQGVGSNGQVLVADSGVTNGVAWVDPQTNRNVIINGAMQIAQRGTSTASITTRDYYTVDRFAFGPTTMGTWTMSVENDAPTGSGFRKSAKMLCTTADASPAANDFVRIDTSLEGQNLQQFLKGTSSAKGFSLSFWVKSNVTGTYIVNLYDTDNTRSVSGSYTISASATWEKKTITFPADTTGAFDNDNNASALLIFGLGSGSTLTSGTLNTTWESAVNANRFVGQTNVASATNNYWQITGVQLEAGAVATPFEFEDYGTTLAKCQRYYFRTSQASPASFSNFANGVAGTTLVGEFIINMPVSMRIAPTTFDSSAAGTFYISSQSGAGAATSITTNGYRATNLSYGVVFGTSGLTAGQSILLLQDSTDTAFLAASAEL